MTLWFLFICQTRLSLQIDYFIGLHLLLVMLNISSLSTYIQNGYLFLDLDFKELNYI